MLYIVVSYHCMQFQGKVMNQTWKNGKKLVLSTILAPSAQIWAPKIFFMDFTSTIYKALLQAIIVFNFKEN